MSDIQKTLASSYLTMPSEQFRNVFEAKLVEMYRDNYDADEVFPVAMAMFYRIQREYPKMPDRIIAFMVVEMLHMNPESAGEFMEFIEGETGEEE